MQLSARDLKRLEGVHPDLVRVVRRAADITDIRFMVVEGLRTRERQAELLRKGASKTLRSRHLTGHAVDLAPLLDLDGDGQVDDIPWSGWAYFEVLARFVKSAAVVEGVSIEWGGDWRDFKDGPHWQLPWKAYP